MQSKLAEWIGQLWIAWDGLSTVVLGSDAHSAFTSQGILDKAEDPDGWVVVVGMRRSEGWESGVLLDAFRLFSGHGWARLLHLPTDFDALSLGQTEAGEYRECGRVVFTREIGDVRRGRLLYALKQSAIPRREVSNPVTFGSRALPRTDSLRVIEQLSNTNQEPLWAIEAPQTTARSDGIWTLVVAPLIQVYPRRAPAIAVEAEPLLNKARSAPPLDAEFPSIIRLVHSWPIARARLLLVLPLDQWGQRDMCSGIAVGHALQQRTIPQTVAHNRPDLTVTPLRRQQIEAWTEQSAFNTPGESEVVHAVNLLAALEGRQASPDISIERLTSAGREAGKSYVRVTFRGAGRGDMLFLLDTLEKDRLLSVANTSTPSSFLAFEVGREHLQPVRVDSSHAKLHPIWDAGSDDVDNAATERAASQSDATVHEGFEAWMRSAAFGGTAGQLFAGLRNPSSNVLPLMIRAFEEALSRADAGSALAWGEGALPKFTQFAADPAAVSFVLEHPGLVGVFRPLERGSIADVRTLSGGRDHLAYRVSNAVGIPNRYQQQVDGPTQIKAFLSLVHRRGEFVRLLTAARVRFGPCDLSLEQLGNTVLPALIEAASEPFPNKFIETLDDIEAPSDAREVQKYVEGNHRGQDIDLSAAVRVAEMVTRAREKLAEEEAESTRLPVPPRPLNIPQTRENLKAEFDRLLEQADRVTELAARATKLRQRAAGATPTRDFYRRHIAKLRSDFEKPATAESVGRILDRLEAWAGLVGLTIRTKGASAGEAPYEARLQAVLHLVQRANISLDRRSGQQNRGLSAKRDEITQLISERLDRLPETSDFIDPKLREQLADYACVLVHHKAYGIIRHGLHRHDAPRTNEDRARLARRLALWPRSAETTWSHYLRWTDEVGGARDGDLAPPHFD